MNATTVVDRGGPQGVPSANLAANRELPLQTSPIGYPCGRAFTVSVPAALGASPTAVLAANGKRGSLYLKNIGSTTIYIQRLDGATGTSSAAGALIDDDATTVQQLLAGEWIEEAYLGAVNAYSSANPGTLQVRELQN